jgi:hypothetical protein
MDRKKLLAAGVLIGFIICLVPAFMIISFGLTSVSEIIHPLPEYNADNASFNNLTPELTAVSIARLNFGTAFNEVTVEDVHLTDDGKYWIVGIDPNDAVPHVDVTIDAKTLMSKRNLEGEYGEWRSLDELKASYIAEIQANHALSKPQKITMGGKEIWKISIVTDINDETGAKTVKYIYVDIATGKSKNTLDEFEKAAGTDGWLTLKEVDGVINKGDYQLNYLYDREPGQFRDVLRDSYQE